MGSYEPRPHALQSRSTAEHFVVLVPQLVDLLDQEAHDRLTAWHVDHVFVPLVERNDSDEGRKNVVRIGGTCVKDVPEKVVRVRHLKYSFKRYVLPAGRGTVTEGVELGHQCRKLSIWIVRTGELAFACELGGGHRPSHGPGCFQGFCDGR